MKGMKVVWVAKLPAVSSTKVSMYAWLCCLDDVIVVYVQNFIMVYSSTDAPPQMAATLKVHEWHTQIVCVRLVKGLYEPYQSLLSAFMTNWTVNFAGKYR